MDTDDVAGAMAALGAASADGRLDMTLAMDLKDTRPSCTGSTPSPVSRPPAAG